MYKGKKVIVVSPVGREESMRIMFPAVMKQKGVVDEHHLWVNSNVQSDLDYIHAYAEKNPDFVKLKYDGGAESLVDEWKTRANNVKWFYNYCTDSDTYYIKVDDDVVFIEDGMFEKLIDYKLDHPETFLAYPLTINSIWCTHFMREAGVLDIPESECCSKKWYHYYGLIAEKLKTLPQTMSDKYDEPLIGTHNYIPEHAMLCPQYWNNPEFAQGLHELFTDLYKQGRIDELKIPNVVLKSHESASINVACWAGEDFAKFEGNVRCTEDESWLTVFYPAYAGIYSAIVGDTIAVHYSYFIQRSYLNQTDVLDRYAEIYEV